MGLFQAVEVPALDGTCSTFTFARTDDIDFVTSCECVNLDDISDVQCGGVGEAELTKNFLRGNVCLVEMTLFGFAPKPSWTAS